MIRIENVDTYGWEPAIRGMRNPKNSWRKSDSYFTEHGTSVGEEDLKLMKTLGGAGAVHGKFMRMITVTLDITAPLYWWKEFDTYKVGTVANSCSTMHKIHSKEITINDFSFDDCFCPVDEEEVFAREMFMQHVKDCETMRKYYLMYAEKAKNEHFTEKERNRFKRMAGRFWRRLIQMLPTSYNQRRTIQLNYEVLRGMYAYRQNHKLDEWRVFCKWIETLPYAGDLLVGEAK